MESSSKKIGVDIFAGAGGLSLGAQMAGISMKYAIEINPSAVATYRKNFSGTTVLEGDIASFDPDVVIPEKDIFIIMGGPPCQGFSMSNTRSRNMDNEKNHLFEEFLRFVKVKNPQWFLFENVWGMTKIEDGTVAEMIKKRFEALGYVVTSKVLYADKYGVPQHRDRFFMVGNRMGIDFKFPKDFTYTVSVAEAIDDLPILSNGDNFDSLAYRISAKRSSLYAQKMRGDSIRATQNWVSRNNALVIERYKYIPQGGNWRDIPESLMQNYADKSRCHSGIYKRLIANKPSIVISNYRKCMLIHPTQHRGLSVREAARLQSFPDKFYFCGPISHVQQQIGNAVPPLLAKAVIEQILKLAHRKNVVH